MLKSIATSAILFCALGSASSAATITNVELSKGQWTVLEFNNTNAINLVAQSTNAGDTFSFSYAFSKDGCSLGANHNAWRCRKDLETNVVNGAKSYAATEWFGIATTGSATDPFNLSYSDESAEDLFLFFRVSSGSATISQVRDAAVPPATVPLPAAGLMLMAGLASFGGLRLLKRRKAES